MILNKIPRAIFGSLIKCSFSGYSAKLQKMNTYQQKSVRVAVLGGDTSTGEMLAFLLKQNPIVSQIYLYGDTPVLATAADLQHLDTRSTIVGFTGPTGFSKTLKCADIVLIVGMDRTPISASPEDRIKSELDKLIEYTNACTNYAPKSIIGVCTRPIACSLPIVSDIFRGTHWYHPGRIIGCANLAQNRINAFVGHFYDLDPKCVHVPIVGGPDTDNVVPLFSKTCPVYVLEKDVKGLKRKLSEWKQIGTDDCKDPLNIMIGGLSEAYAINQFVTAVGLGLCGDDSSVSAAFVRQNIIQNCRYLVTTVKFGPEGVVHNYGIPILNKIELLDLEKSTLLLREREELALKVFGLTTKLPKEKRIEKMLLKEYAQLD